MWVCFFFCSLFARVVRGRFTLSLGFLKRPMNPLFESLCFVFQITRIFMHICVEYTKSRYLNAVVFLSFFSKISPNFDVLWWKSLRKLKAEH